MNTEYDELRAEVQRLAERVAALELEKGAPGCGVFPVDLPEWAEWIAMDANGLWHVYDDQPTRKGGAGQFWLPEHDSKYDLLEGYTPAHQPHDWRESLMRIR